MVGHSWTWDLKVPSPECGRRINKGGSELHLWVVSRGHFHWAEMG